MRGVVGSVVCQGRDQTRARNNSQLMLFFVGTARVKVGTRPNCAQAGFSGLRDGRAAVSFLRKRGSHSQMSPGDVDDGDGESGGEVPRWSVGRSVGETGLDWMGLGHFQCCTAVTARSKGRESSSKGGKRKLSTGQLSMFGPLQWQNRPALTWMSIVTLCVSVADV